MYLLLPRCIHNNSFISSLENPFREMPETWKKICKNIENTLKSSKKMSKKRKRTSSPIRKNKLLGFTKTKNCVDEEYKEFAKHLKTPMTVSVTRGISSPLPDIFAGHLVMCGGDKVNCRLSKSSDCVFELQENCAGDVDPPQFDEESVKGADGKRYYSLCDINRIFENLDLSFHWKEMLPVVKV